MNEILKHLLYSDLCSTTSNYAILVFRILLALELFRVHGMKKFRGNDGKPEVVPNPLGLPAPINNLIATLSDTVVPLLIVLGALTRLAVLPTIGVTAVGYFVVHRHDSLEVRDVPYIYTICFLLLLVIGPGSYSIDQILYNHLKLK
ncbi:DoxX family protein [Mucilaginibacter pallidiroseus]|uniref:DoxX family protein n=1 Tax=Mucilaginibacter pallidiroseus TaxID=2599295 RepID=A0A563UEB4_9SPHI|nr:DoxX family protein [Mucilaginibacter pallidiroseus]TWR29633.1 DoxX family protein [Mucilaginibacter pallidiroseus]